MQQFTSQQSVLLQEIRKYILKKQKNAPHEFTIEEFAIWERNHCKYFLIDGYLHILDNNVIPEGTHEIVVRKKSAREKSKPCLIFSTPSQFKDYCNAAFNLGVTVYYLFEEKCENTLSHIMKDYSVMPSACNKIQDKTERLIGLYYSADLNIFTDEHLYAALSNYTKEALYEKAMDVLGKEISVVNVDIFDWEGTLNTESDSIYVDSNDFISVDTTDLDYTLQETDKKKLIKKIADIIYEKSLDKYTKYDIKDKLLGQIVVSEYATGEFVLAYYNALKGRKSVWRPVAFSYQVQYAFEHGKEFLKNPAYIRECANVKIGEMIAYQLKYYSASDKSALTAMRRLSEKAKEEDTYNKILLECASDSEQIGKALSKELRTDEAIGALSRALYISASEKLQMPIICKTQGDEYHE